MIVCPVFRLPVLIDFSWTAVTLYTAMYGCYADFQIGILGTQCSLSLRPSLSDIRLLFLELLNMFVIRAAKRELRICYCNIDWVIHLMLVETLYATSCKD